MKLIIIAMLFIITFSNAKSYTLYIASSKYIEVAKKYYNEVKRIYNQDKLLIRGHKANNYSLIIRDIQSIETAKKLKNILENKTTFNDMYIRRIYKEPSYEIIIPKKLSAQNKTVKEIKKREFTQEEPQDDKNIQYDSVVEESNEYITASVMFNTQQYEKSYEMFFKLFSKNPYNININYFLALSAIYIGKVDEALVSLERVLLQNPKFNQARLVYAKLLFDLNFKEEAKKEFLILKAANINENIKKIVNEYLSNIKQKTKKTFISSNILVGAGVTSNVNNGLIETSYRIPGLNNLEVIGEKPIKDTFHNEMISLEFSNSLNDTNSINIINSFSIYGKEYLNQTIENMKVLSYKPSILYKDTKNNNFYSLDLGISRMDKKSNEDFNSYGISPSFFNKKYFLSLDYQRLIYLSDVNKNKNFNTYGFLLKYNILKNLNVYTQVYKYKKLNSNRTDIDRLSSTLGATYFYKIDKKNILKGNFEFSLSKYKDFNEFFLKKREDKNYFLSLDYLYRIDDLTSIMLSSSYSRNNSNQSPYIYEVLEGKINFIKTFNF